MKRLLLIVFLALALVLTVATFNTFNLQTVTSDIPAAERFTPDARAAAERLSGALRIPTISYDSPEQNDTTAFLSLQEYLAQHFPRVHATLNHETVSQFSLVYTWPGSDARLPPVVLLAHLDVVPVDPATESAWAHAPFSGDIDGGFVWGRGALDDKSAALAQLEAIEALLAEGFQPKRSLYLAFGHDEEIGGVDGAARIVELLARLGVRPGMVLDEGGAIVSGVMQGVDMPLALVGIAEKGTLSVVLSADNPGGHSSMPPEHSAVGLVARSVTRLEDHPMPAQLVAPVRQMFAAVGPHMALPRRLMVANLELSQALVKYSMGRKPETNALIRTTTAATMFSGGPKQNVLPARAAAVVNFRILPGDTREAVLRHVAEVVNDGNIHISALPRSAEPSVVSPTDNDAYSLLETTIRQTSGGEGLVVAPYLVVGQTDARYYSALTNNVYRFQPHRLHAEDLARIHGRDERISVENYAELIRFYHQLIRNLNPAG